LEIKKKFYGDDHLEYAKTLKNFGITLNYLGEYEKSKEVKLKAI
jgi:hypothetical protein